MGRSSSSSPCNEKSKRLRSEDYRRPRRSRSEENADYKDKRRQALLIQQEREKEHKRFMKKMILEYELKRAESLHSREHSRRPSYRSRSQSRSRDHRSTDCRRSPKPTTMLQKMESATDGNTSFFKGGSEISISPLELRRIRVDIHRNIPGATVANSQLQRQIVNPEEVILKRREDEGINPIFDRHELKLPECSKSTQEVEEHRTVKVIDTERAGKRLQSTKRRSRSLSSLTRRDKSPKESSLSRRSRLRHKEYHQSRNRENGRRDSLHDHTEHSSSHRPDRKEYSSKRRSSRERSYSEERKRRHSELDRLSRDGQSYREYRGRSRERRERQRSVEKRERDRPRERRMSTLPHYIEPVPAPVYYENFRPRPAMMGPTMPIRGPLMRNRLPIGPRLPFPPRFIHPNIYRSSLPPNPRFNRRF